MLGKLSELSTRSIGDNDLGGFRLFNKFDRCGGRGVFSESLFDDRRSTFCLLAGFNFGILPNGTGGSFGDGVSIDFFTVAVVVIEMEVSDDFFSTDFDGVFEDDRLVGLSLFFVSTTGLVTGVLMSFFGITVVVVGFFGVTLDSFGVIVDLKYRVFFVFEKLVITKLSSYFLMIFCSIDFVVLLLLTTFGSFLV